MRACEGSVVWARQGVRSAGLVKTSQGCEARSARQKSHDTCNVTMEPQGGKRHMSSVTRVPGVFS